MCQPAETESKKRDVKAVVIPVIAALLHLNVFYQSLFNFLLYLPSLNDGFATSFIQRKIAIHDASILVAYVFDLICCYCFKIIPFSRCHKSSDIAGHHIPVIFALVLCVPCWAGGGLKSIEPLVMDILHYKGDQIWRTKMVYSILQGQGFGFLSSLNEFFMCMQRAEMNLNGLQHFNDLSTERGMKRRWKLATSSLIIGIELYFKCCIFCGFSFFIVRALCGFDKAVYGYYMMKAASDTWQTRLHAIKGLVLSPLFMRCALIRLFILSMYPSMGKRTIQKIRQYHSQQGKTI
uniref:TLC domain-containing protein n=1 Tax=Helicotheca tamesis TaxID=374047 RepID=A0A7S2HVF9_9STRA|mmetsp:Transcript_293/g.318  ORF Transcript_293/g.318 Transcript_293/m.318 type:complete len:292 (+) Transcript_293:131-1006(+)